MNETNGRVFERRIENRGTPFAEYLQTDPWETNPMMNYVPVAHQILRTFNALTRLAAYRAHEDRVAMSRMVENTGTPLAPFNEQELDALANPDSDYLDQMLELTGRHLERYGQAISHAARFEQARAGGETTRYLPAELQGQEVQDLVQVLTGTQRFAHYARDGNIDPAAFRGVGSPIPSHPLPDHLTGTSHLDDTLLGVQATLTEMGQMTARPWSPNITPPYQTHRTHRGLEFTAEDPVNGGGFHDGN